MGDLLSAITLSYGMDVITPAIMFNGRSAPGECGRSIDATEEPRVCRDDRDPESKSPPKYLPSSLTFLLSFLLLREKNDLPPDDCLDLVSDDMFGTPSRVSIAVMQIEMDAQSGL